MFARMMPLIIGLAMLAAPGAAVAQVWLPMGSGMDDAVEELFVYDGELIAGGRFGVAGGVGASRIASWDGAAWKPLGDGIGGSNVLALAEYDGDLIAAGGFTMAGGASAANIARWDGESWFPLGSGVGGGGVGALTAHDGRLIVGGNFETAGGAPANGIAAWDGSSWAPLGAEPGTWSVRSLMTFEGDLLAGVTMIGEGASVMRWDGASWTRMGDPLGTGGFDAILALTVYDGQLTAAAPGSGLSRWDGAAWETMTTGGVATINGVVHDLVQRDSGGFLGNELFLCGQFNSIATPTGPVSVRGLVAWAGGDRFDEPDGGITSAFPSPLALAVYDGDIILGGGFEMAGGSSAANIARLGRPAPAGCYADCDDSGALDFFDFLCFQNAFAAGCP